METIKPESNLWKLRHRFLTSQSYFHKTLKSKQLFKAMDFTEFVKFNFMDYHSFSTVQFTATKHPATI